MKNLLVALIIALPVIAHAQTVAAKEGRYCEVQVTAKMFTKKITINIDYGTDPLAKDNVPKKDNDDLKQFTNITDVLNYMARNGWKLVTSYATTNNGITDAYHFFFRKEF
jgi:hypothetical protein